MENKEQEELLFRVNMLEQQAQQIQQQLQSIEQGIVELGSLNLGLDEFRGSTDREILAQIKRGVFVNAKILSDELIVDIGNGDLVKKSIPETKKIIEEQIVKLENVKNELSNDLEKISAELGLFVEIMQKGKKD